MQEIQTKKSLKTEITNPKSGTMGPCWSTRQSCVKYPYTSNNYDSVDPYPAENTDRFLFLP